jgi:hypothetical protein
VIHFDLPAVEVDLQQLLGGTFQIGGQQKGWEAVTSGVTSKPANEGHLKTGQRA